MFVIENMMELKTMNYLLIVVPRSAFCEIFYTSLSTLDVGVDNVARLKIEKDFKDTGMRMIEVLDHRIEAT